MCFLVCFQMDLKLIFIAFIGLFYCCNSQKGKIGFYYFSNMKLKPSSSHDLILLVASMFSEWP